MSIVTRASSDSGSPIQQSIRAAAARSARLAPTDLPVMRRMTSPTNQT